MIPLWAYPIGLGVRLLALMVGRVQHGGVSEVFHSTVIVTKDSCMDRP